MRIAALPAMPGALPLWPPLLATRGPGGLSEGHAHHAMHLALACTGTLTVRLGDAVTVQRAAGVLTAPDVLHALDARGCDVLLVFIDPESQVGASLQRILRGPVRMLAPAERDALVDVDPMSVMQSAGAAWTARAVATLGGEEMPATRAIHPRVRRLLALLRTQPPREDVSLSTLAARVGLSEGRLMHAFTESVGVPLRPYLAWLKLQRAAAAVASGRALSDAAQEAGFADAAHMTRSFKRTLGITPSAVRPAPGPSTRRRT